MEKEQGFVIDLRSPWEYAAYHIPGAVNIPYERLKKVRGLPKNVPLIFTVNVVQSVWWRQGRWQKKDTGQRV